MTTIIESHLSIIYFNTFEKYLSQIKNIEYLAVLSRIQYHCKNSKINKSGKIWFTRKKSELAEWFGLSNAKITSILFNLKELGLIECANFKFKGIKQLHVSIKDLETIYIGFEALEKVISVTGNLKTAFLYLKILYGFNNSKIEHDGKKWVAKSREELATWSNISLRTLDKCITHLEELGLLLKRTYKWQGAPICHFHIIEEAVETIFTSMTAPTKTINLKKIEKTQTDSAISTSVDKKEASFFTPLNNEICTVDSAKSELPYIKETNLKNPIKKTNNTDEPVNNSISQKEAGDMSFVFSNREEGYLKGALSNLIQRDKVKISSPKELLEQVKFSVSNWVRDNKMSFSHAVNRACMIIKSGNWHTPMGFYKHSDLGKKYHEAVIQREKFSEEKRNRALDYQNQEISNLLLSIERLQNRLSTEENELKKSLIQGQISRLQSEFSDLSRSTQQNFLVAS